MGAGGSRAGLQAVGVTVLGDDVRGANHLRAAGNQRRGCFAGQPATAAERAAALRPGGQADALPVPGAARAHPAEHQHHVPRRLLRAAHRGEREEAQSGQVKAAFVTWPSS